MDPARKEQRIADQRYQRKRAEIGWRANKLMGKYFRIQCAAVG